MTDRELFEKELEALQAYGAHAPNCDHLMLLTSLPPQRKPCSCGLVAAITALRERLAQPNDFNPDWDAMAVMVEEQQRMAKRIAELEAQPQRTHWDGYEEVHPECRKPRREWVACKTLCELCVKRGYTFCANAVKTTPINAPQRREWVGLTDEEIERACVPLGAAMLSFTDVARAIEAKLREKNT